MGAETLSQQHKPPDKDWEEFTVTALNAAATTKRPVLFDLTHVEDMDDLLQATGPYASAITSVELRYVHRNWAVFRRVVQFYENGVEREAPWITSSP